MSAILRETEEATNATSNEPSREALSETSLRRAAMLKTAFGPVIGAALEDASVTEIMVNPDGALWIERHGTGRVRERATVRSTDAERIIRLVASAVGAECDRARPIVSAELPGGERFEGLLPPVVAAPAFSIRKGAARVLSLDDYVEAGVLRRADALVLQRAVARRWNILIAGGAASGKTTLANALLAEIAKQDERVVLLEDTRELLCAAEDCVALRTSNDVGLAALVRSTLHLRPDRIVVGEVRGGEALDLLKAWNTGHPGGLATLHANSASAALTRLEQLIGERTSEVSRALIAEAVDVVVFIAKTADGRRVREILRVEGWDADGYRLAQPSARDLSLVGDASPPHETLNDGTTP